MSLAEFPPMHCLNNLYRATSGLCGKFGNKLFTATVVRARRKNAGIAGPTSSFFNAAMAAVAKKSVTELSKQPTRPKDVIKIQMSLSTGSPKQGGPQTIKQWDEATASTDIHSPPFS